MKTTRHPLARRSRATLLALTLTIASIIGSAVPASVMAQDASAEPETDPASAACDSAADLRLIIGFLQDTSISEDGLIPVAVGGIAGVSVARDLAGQVGETLSPLVEDLIVSLQGLRDISDQVSDDDTLGARMAILGASIVEIGEAMDALSLQLQERCPTDQ